MKYILLLYLQLLYLIGYYISGRSCVDNKILSCYNKLDKLGVKIDPEYYFKKS